jgi:hypothetical protein
MMFSLQKSFLKIALEVLRVHRGLKLHERHIRLSTH